MRTCTLLILGWLVLGPVAAAADPSLEEIDAIVEAARKEFEAPGVAVVVVRDDKVIHLKGYGVREVGTNKAVSGDTVFPLASCTKAFTATAIALQVDQDRMRWDDSVRKHLPGFHLKDPLADRDVAIRDLLCHRTGLTRHDSLRFVSSRRADLLKRIAHLEPEYSFRSRFEYNNLMYLVAGEAAAAADGQPWEDLVRKRLFEPLGMKSASATGAGLEQSPDFAQPHRHNEKNKVEVLPWVAIDVIGPAGAINASARDLAPWLRLQLGEGVLDGKRIVSARNLRETHLPQMVIRNEGRWALYFPPDVTDQLSYGLGWFVHDYRGHAVVSHGGTLGGIRSQVVLVPRAKLGLAVLSNLGATHSDMARLPEAVSRSLLDHFLKLSARDWNRHFQEGGKKRLAEAEEKARKQKAARQTNTKPTLELVGYTGAFEDAAYGEAKVAQEGGQLVLRWAGFTFPLEHYHFDTFQAGGHPQFNAGNLIAFQVECGKVKGLTFLERTFRRARE